MDGIVSDYFFSNRFAWSDSHSTILPRHQFSRSTQYLESRPSVGDQQTFLTESRTGAAPVNSDNTAALSSVFISALV
ncbi:hypothetical protein RRG08_048633 [Elysia crispata]|uniref:Uncharacterized protein n=1 Tax=Elysia crispata TaxID=231223 RepID=A0AAE1ACV2_9GAST|nr:hypothetical protein RRG08_048633 [Elysia crispata]